MTDIERIAHKWCEAWSQNIIALNVAMPSALTELAALKDAEIERWKGLSDLKDAKGEANRTENNKLRGENNQLRARLAEASAWRNEAERELIERGKQIGELCSKQLALEAQNSKMREALEAAGNMTMMPIESEEEAESNTRRIHEQELQHVVALVQNALSSPLDLELLGRVKYEINEINNVSDLYVDNASTELLQGALVLIHRRADALLKSLTGH